MAEGIFKKLIGTKIFVQSAGVYDTLEIDGFTVQVKDGSTCLLGPSGEMFSCTPWPQQEEEQTEQEYLIAITEAFHEEAFGLSTGLSGAQWNSLDATTTSSKRAAREQLEQLLLE